jgi:hypothetical protein
MRNLILFSIIALTACTQERPPLRSVPQSANPSAIVAVELAFAREARDKGEVQAYKKYAAKDALIFRPQPVLFHDYSKSMKDDGKTARWQPHKIYMSCDGRTAISSGAWQRADENGYYTMVWQWFPKTKEAALLQGTLGEGEWRWILRHGDTVQTPLPAVESIETKVASCKGKAGAPLVAPPVGAKMKANYAFDQSLQWTWVVKDNGTRSFTARLWNGTILDEVIAQNVAAPVTIP